MTTSDSTVGVCEGPVDVGKTRGRKRGVSSANGNFYRVHDCSGRQPSSNYRRGTGPPFPVYEIVPGTRSGYTSPLEINVV